MEYGLDVSLPVYSGGLGMLSGDHLKTSSDLGLPLVGVGLLYRQGYFQQYLNMDGFQQESYPENDWYNMPVTLCRDAQGAPLSVQVELGPAAATAWIWKVKVGKNSLYLLDTNIEANPQPLRLITASLYGGDRETRIQQEILLGIGGIRALQALGIKAACMHMNEGHSAFLGLERIRQLMKDGKLSFSRGMAVRLVHEHLHHPYPGARGQRAFRSRPDGKVLRRDRARAGPVLEGFSRPGPGRPQQRRGGVLPHRARAAAVRVQQRGEPSARRGLPHRCGTGSGRPCPMDEIPITHITNGVHPRTWIAHDMIDLLDRYFGPEFHDAPTNLDIWDRIDRVSDEELWRTHERRRERMVAFARMRLQQQLERRGVTNSELSRSANALSPYTLTISFARRFATYKRADLLLSDPDRLMRLLTNNERPVQMIFAGKAHPHDLAGKEIIKRIVHFSSDPRVASRIIFLEDYDMTMSRYLMSGSDLWLNTPRRPLEASGTSGMKAAMNGTLNLSILDGWWDEAYSTHIGWAVGQGRGIRGPRPAGRGGGQGALRPAGAGDHPAVLHAGAWTACPREWIRKMKESMREVGKRFSSHRMLLEYAGDFYAPALANARAFSAKGCSLAREVAAYLAKLESALGRPAHRGAQLSSGASILTIGDKISVKARIFLAGLSPEELGVELYYGALSSQGEIEEPRRLDMSPCGVRGTDAPVLRRGGVRPHRPARDTPCASCPSTRRWCTPSCPGLVKWG